MKFDSSKWTRIKKFLALITSMSLWVVSIYFSYLGFNYGNKEIGWVGVVMAGGITVLELIFNTNSFSNLSNRDVEFGEYLLILGGFLAYLYDIYTNILGLYSAQGLTAPSNWLDTSIIIPLLVGIFMAILPEPMLVWSLGLSKYVPTTKQEQVQKPVIHKTQQQSQHLDPKIQKIRNLMAQPQSQIRYRSGVDMLKGIEYE